VVPDGTRTVVDATGATPFVTAGGAADTVGACSTVGGVAACCMSAAMGCFAGVSCGVAGDGCCWCGVVARTALAGVTMPRPMVMAVGCNCIDGKFMYAAAGNIRPMLASGLMPSWFMNISCCMCVALALALAADTDDAAVACGASAGEEVAETGGGGAKYVAAGWIGWVDVCAVAAAAELEAAGADGAGEGLADARRERLDEPVAAPAEAGPAC
jgi:hypothetical protein